MATVSVSQLCVEHQLNVKQLAEKALLDESLVLAIIMGRWTPSPQERKKVADAFGVEVDGISWGHKTPIQHIYGHGPG